MANKLPVWKTVSTAWRMPVIHWRALIRIVWFPLLLLLALDLSVEMITASEPVSLESLPAAEEWKPIDPAVETPEGHARRTDSDGREYIAKLPEGYDYQSENEFKSSLYFTIAMTLLRMAIIVPAMVAWQFAVWPPAGSDQGTGVMPLKLGMREFRYLGFGLLLFVATAVFHLWTYSLVFTAIKSLSAWNVALLASIGQFFWLAIMSYPALRLSPFLALRARGDGGSLDEIWRMTKGNGWRLVAVFTLSTLPFAFFAVIARFNADFSHIDAPLIFKAVSATLLLAAGIITASWLSLAAYTLQNNDTEESASDPASDANGKLQVWQTITDSFAFLLENRGFALRYGWIAVAGTFLLGLLVGLVPDLGIAGEALTDLVESAFLVPIIAVVIVPWHRMILLRESPDGIGFGGRVKQYILLALQMYAMYWVLIWITYGPALVADGLGGRDSVLTLTSLFYMASGITVLIVFCLIAPILPAAAVGRYSGFKDAFELSRKNRIGFVFVNTAVMVPSIVVLWFLPDALFEGNWAYAGELIASMIFVFNGFIGATALSLCYHRLGGMQGDAGAEPPTASP